MSLKSKSPDPFAANLQGKSPIVCHCEHLKGAWQSPAPPRLLRLNKVSLAMTEEVVIASEAWQSPSPAEIASSLHSSQRQWGTVVLNFVVRPFRVAPCFTRLKCRFLRASSTESGPRTACLFRGGSHILPCDSPSPGGRELEGEG